MTYYVTMTDKFMSGWGLADGLINKLIFLCEDYNQAKIVAENAERRTEMKYVNISGARPAYFRKTKGTDYECGNYYVQIKDNSDYSTWYKPNQWIREA